MRHLIIKAIVFFTLIILFTNYVINKTFYTNDPSWILDADNNFFRKTTLAKGLENRVMFDEDIGWALSRENTDRIIHDLLRAGFNVYVPCVWHGAGAYFDTKIAYTASRLNSRFLEGDDPLAYLIRKAHENNIEVHPWVTVVRRDDSRYKQFYDAHSPKNAFNVHNKHFREFIISLIMEIVENYQVDGLNLDYIRSMGYCTSEECENEYRAMSSRNLNLDLILEKIPKSRIKSIEEWNEQPIEEIVKSVSQLAKMIKPKLMLSVDSVPGARHLRMQGHDSEKWLNNNWIDTIFYMEYKNDFNISDIELSKSNVNRPDAIIPLFSLYDMESPEFKKKSGALLQKTILAARKIWPDSGIAYYHYKQLSNEQIKMLHSSVYAESSCSTWHQCEFKK